MQHINTLLDPVVNFGKVTVSTGYTSTDTTITLITGDGSKLPNPVPSGSFNLVWFNNSTYSDPADDPYVEIVRCIARVGDVLTLMRAQEGTLASDKNIPTKIYKMILSATKKTITDIQAEYQSGVSAHSILNTGVHGIGVDTIDGVSARNIAISTHSLATSNVHNFDSSGNAPAQTHGISRHTGTIGTWSGIDKTISSIADITTRSHTLLTDIGTNTHAIIDTAILNSTTHIGSSIAHNTSSNIVGISDTQTLTNKTLTSPFISTIYGGSAANDDIIIEGTSNATKTSSYVILQPTSGNVGIGTTNPQGKLHINVGTDQNFVFRSVGSIARLEATNDAFSSDVPIEFSATQFNFVNGNVGIGTTGPQSPLSIYRGGGSWQNIATFWDDSATGIPHIIIADRANPNGLGQGGLIGYDKANQNLILGQAGLNNNVFVINNAGNVGIGTTNPTAKLHISGTPGTDGIKFPDGTLQTTAAGGAAVNLLIGLTPTFTLWDSLPSTNAQITDENLDQAFTTAGGFTRENWVYISFDLGSEKRIAALAYIESASQYRSGIQFSHNGSTWYSVPNGIGKTRYIRAGMYGSYPPMTYTCTKFKMSAYAL